MGEQCNSRKWEDDIYWSFFQTVHFFQFLSGSFDHQLAIPKKFANNLKEKLPVSVSLKGPSGATWNVELIADGDALFLKHGWKDFVDAHILKEDDLLIFKYNEESQFDVLMFDRQSLCEKEASYFVKACACTDAVSGGKTKRSIPESNDKANEPSHEVFEGTSRIIPRETFLQFQEMGEECNSRKWEEDIYWSCFQVFQFFQVLSDPFDQQLAIPQIFTNNLREKLSVCVTLEGPSGATWNVGLIADGDALFLKHGWKEFVDAHVLKEDDLLIFKYNGDSRFDVLMFDSQSLCEKEASYFVKACARNDAESGGKTERSIPESYDKAYEPSHEVFEGTARIKPQENVDTSIESSHEVFEGIVRKNPRKNGACTSISATRAKGKLPIRKRIDTADESSHEVFEGIARKKPGENGVSTPTSGNRAKGKLQTREIKSTSSKTRSGTQLKLKSNRRAVNEEEKRKALDMSTVAVTENSLRVVMRSSHVYQGFYMSIPSGWARIHLPFRNGDVMLRVNESTWQARVYEKRFNCGLAGGWRNFVLDNFLEEFDVCVFNLTIVEDVAPILDVSIFRVVEEVIPPSQVRKALSSRAKEHDDVESNEISVASSSKRQRKSVAWDYFEELPLDNHPDKRRRAECKTCGHIFLADSKAGTKSLNRHLEKHKIKALKQAPDDSEDEDIDIVIDVEKIAAQL